MRDVFAGKRHGFTGLRVAALSRRTEMQREAAEATDFDALTGGQCVAHDLEHLLERQLHILGRQMLLLGGDQFDEFRLRNVGPREACPR